MITTQLLKSYSLHLRCMEAVPLSSRLEIVVCWKNVLAGLCTKCLAMW